MKRRAGGWIGGEEHISYLFYKFCPLKLTNKLNKNYRYHEIKITRDLPLSAIGSEEEQDASLMGCFGESHNKSAKGHLRVIWTLCFCNWDLREIGQRRRSSHRFDRL